MNEIKDPEEIKLDLITAIEYIKEKRDDALENFNDKLKVNDYTHDATMHDALSPVLRFNLQLKTLEDCLIVLRVAKANAEKDKKSESNG